MLNTLIVGASGYAGAELVTYINRHPHMNITALTVSAQSNDAGKLISDLHPQLKGIVWFRLPLPDDQRSWPLPTLQALVRGEELSATLHTELQANQGRFDIVLRNTGNLSARLPDNLSFRGLQCLGGDTSDGYQWQQQGGDWWLQRNNTTADTTQITPQQARTVAWLRCQQLHLISTPAD